jgi:hypothetical protein
MRRTWILAAAALLALAAAWRWAVAEPVAGPVARQVYAACEAGDTGRLALLARLGVPINAAWERPLLGVAGAAGRLDAMAWLLDAGASRNGAGRFATPLEVAARAGRVDAVRWLLDHGAKPNIKGVGLPLEAAVRGCHPEVAEVLLGRGARPLPTEVGVDAAAVAGAKGCRYVEQLAGAVEGGG